VNVRLPLTGPRLGCRALAAMVLAGAAAACAGGGDAGTGERLTVTDGWAAEAAEVAAVYLQIDNPGPPDRLVDATTPAAGTVTVMVETAGAGTHTAPAGPIDVDVPTGSMNFGPGEGHIMLSELAERLRPGDHVDLTLVFDRNGSRTVEVEILSWAEVVERNERG
jgi:periplasmic copper chaperone A